jgi:hypothetical protein
MITRPTEVLAALTGSLLVTGCPAMVDDHDRVGSLTAGGSDGESSGTAGSATAAMPETADDSAATGGTGADPGADPGVVGCLDRKRDGTETDKDCGGGTCAPCADGKHCLADTDCRSGNCNKALKCAAR